MTSEPFSAKAEQIRSLVDQYTLATYRRSKVLSHGKGSYVWDVDGFKYLDLSGGVAVNCLGHAHPAIVEALQKQASQLIHISNHFYHESAGLLAKQLVDLTGPGRIFFCNSGAEANELFYKLVRKFGHETGRYEIITALDSFHGRTLAGIAATGQEKVRKDFEPVIPGFSHVPFNDLSALEQAITPRTAAVLIEGIQGEGGITCATADYLIGVRRLTKDKNLLLGIDAIQCGFFRTGCFQSYERILENHSRKHEFLPDVISMAKSLGGGFPMGAVWLHDSVQGLIDTGSHGTTFGGSPLACAVSLAVLDVIKKENLAKNIRQQGERLMNGLRKLAQTKPIADVRGLGGMVGLEVKGDVAEAREKLAEGGLLFVPSGRNTLRFLPPLNVSAHEIDEALEIVEKYL